MENVNLNAMLTLKNAFHLPVGLSDHSVGIEVPIAAVAMGATVIEKHFTLDRTMIGPDHKASIEPDELKAMVSAIRNIEVSLGDGKKICSLGLRIRKGCSFHGLAFNINMDLNPFHYINPCGYAGLEMCQLADFIGKEEATLDKVSPKLIKHFAELLGYNVTNL